jgi:hypothetical protein
MRPDPRHAVIMTQPIKASQLFDPQHYGSMFIDDNTPQHGPDGQPAYFAREVKTTSDHFDTAMGGREQITIEFADGTPGRVFNLEGDVVVHNILRGTDITES